MAIQLIPAPFTSPMLDANGNLTPGWVNWFHNLRVVNNYSGVIIEVDIIKDAVALTEFTSGLSAVYTRYTVDLINLTFSGSTLLKLLVSTDNGVNYDTTNGHYGWGNKTIVYEAASITEDNDSDLTDAYIPLTMVNATNDAGNVMNGVINIYNPVGGGQTMLTWDISYMGAAGILQNTRGMGLYLSTTPITALKLLPSSGNIATGRVVLTGFN